MSYLENKLYNDSMSENTKVLSNHNNSLRNVLQYKDSDNTFIRPTDKKAENNLKNSFVTTEKHLQKENTESKEESLDLNELLKTEFDLPQDLKVFDPKKLQFDNLLENALNYYRNNQSIKAIPILKKLLEINSNNLKVMRFLSECLLRQNKAREGLATAQKGLEASQKQINKYYIIIFHALIAHGFEALKEFKNAIKHYKLALFHDITKFKNNVDLVKCYLKFNNVDEAYEALEIAKDRGDKKYVESFFYTLAQYHYYQQKNYDEARKFLELASGHNPNCFEYVYMAALCYKNTSRTERAINCFEKAFELKPTEKHILDEVYQLAQIFSEESQEEFIEWLTRQKYHFPQSS